MSSERGFSWASTTLLWVWVLGVLAAAGAGLFVGSSTGNVTLGLAWGIALVIAWIIGFALARSRRRRPYRGVDEDEPSGP